MKTLSENYDIAIVGAGISGLAMAFRIAQSGKKVLLLEANERAGGCLNTLYSDDDFWVEMGAHTFYSSYTNVIGLIQSIGLEADIVAREKLSMKLFTNKHEKIFAPLSKWELLTNVPKLIVSKRDGKTVKEYFSNVLGKKNYNKVFTRMFSAVIVQNADDFSAEYFLKRRKTKSESHPKSFILKKGMSSIANAILAHENIDIAYNKRVSSIEKAVGFSIQTEDGSSYQAKDLAFASSPKEVSNLLNVMNSELADLLSEFPIQNLESMTLILEKDKPGIEPVTFVIPLQGACYSMVTRDVLPDEKYRGFACHFQQDDASNGEQATTMARLLAVDEIPQPVKANHTLPLIKVGHKERLAAIISQAQKTGIYITGNFFNGLSLEDCVERSNEEAKRYLGNH
ncbi:FAD-dependent oxidoreductase [Ancylomarina euxinus]|uniref:FAD-dependent oxidoreductase n=1 Tax=Ancylomarina euxinus TaxID=2283627 RepID=A0A425XX17_9BACT|nr:FAD-dependent oxidoreductase [Ancylomarina euxinus]MCZ4696250.1 FAD-dependent oxidoreductase [Ancylomarina euxinus]MUP16625.1 FAD-dependent oxidoreductase [Ancylomarina euxinus]RRG19185.1 FAD-dependent oxidoreductase [Ancylomarina euxinus]